MTRSRRPWPAVLLVLASAAAPTASAQDQGGPNVTTTITTLTSPPSGRDGVHSLEPYEAPRFGRAIGEMVVVLGAITFLAYGLLTRLLPRLTRPLPSPGGAGILTVIERLPVDGQCALLVVRLGAHHFLFSRSEQGLCLLAPLDSEEVQAAMEAARAQRLARHPQWFSRLTKRVSEKAP